MERRQTLRQMTTDELECELDRRIERDNRRGNSDRTICQQRVIDEMNQRSRTEI